MLYALKAVIENNLIVTSLIAILIYILVNYVKNVLSYPRGPLPLPILGNVLHFRGTNLDPSPTLKLTEWAKTYGPIYTIWAGQTPILVVSNNELNKEASVVKRNDFIDRPKGAIHDILRSGTQNVFSTNGPHWEALRKVALFAVRKFAISEKLSEFVNEVMDEAIDLMSKQNKAFNPIIYCDFMIYNVLALTAYGKKFGSIDDKMFKDAKRLNEEFYYDLGNGLITDYMPWLRPFYYKREERLKDMTKASVDITRDTFNEHKKDYSPGIIRDFSDAVLEAKEEAIRENFARNQYLNDSNLFMVVSDLFQAGTDTSQTTMRWVLLLLANDPKLQQNIYKEIVDNIGDREPTHEDKEFLHYTYAFIMEVLRFRPPAPIGLDHLTTVDTELAGHTIPKNTIVIFNLFAQNMDPKYWTNPEEFNPNRFLDSDGIIIPGRLPSYVTFGLGRRNCPGEKLALNNVFLMVTRLVQKMTIELSTGAGTADLVPINLLVAFMPKDYEILCHLRK